MLNHYTIATAMKLAETIGKLYYSITEVDLSTGEALVFKNANTPEDTGKIYPWTELVSHNLSPFFSEDIPHMLHFLSLDNLNRLLDQPDGDHRLELRTLINLVMPRWIEIEVSVISQEDKKVLITARDINDQRLVQNIVNLYVYRNCDYFICLNAQLNSYKMLWRQDNELSLPPPVSDDYEGTFSKYIHDYVAPEDQDRVSYELSLNQVLTALSENGEFTCMYGVIDPKLGYMRKRLQYLYYDKKLHSILVSRTDMTDFYLDAKKQDENLKKALHRAQIDPLTGLYNHRTIVTLIKQILVTSDAQGALIFLDLDNFKDVNDIQGHPEGDSVLCHVARSISSSVRQSDLAGRIGGDEFIIFLNGLCKLDEIRRCVERIRESVGEYPNSDLKITCSLGIALYPSDGKDFASLLKKADTAMYQAKKTGKADYAFWSEKIGRPR